MFLSSRSAARPGGRRCSSGHDGGSHGAAARRLSDGSGVSIVRLGTSARPPRQLRGPCVKVVRKSLRSSPLSRFKRDCEQGSVALRAAELRACVCESACALGLFWQGFCRESADGGWWCFGLPTSSPTHNKEVIYWLWQQRATHIDLCVFSEEGK